MTAKVACRFEPGARARACLRCRKNKTRCDGARPGQGVRGKKTRKTAPESAAPGPSSKGKGVDRGTVAPAEAGPSRPLLATGELWTESAELTDRQLLFKVLGELQETRRLIQEENEETRQVFQAARSEMRKTRRGFRGEAERREKIIWEYVNEVLEDVRAGVDEDDVSEYVPSENSSEDELRSDSTVTPKPVDSDASYVTESA